MGKLFGCYQFKLDYIVYELTKTQTESSKAAGAKASSSHQLTFNVVFKK